LGKHIGPIFRVRPETSVTANLRCLTSKESEDIRYSFFVLDFILTKCRPKFVEIFLTTYKVDQAWCRVRHGVLLPWPLSVRTTRTKISTHLTCRSRFYACVCKTQKINTCIVITQLSLLTNIILVRVSGDWLWFILYCDHNGQLYWVHRFRVIGRYLASCHALEDLVAVWQRSQVWNFKRK